MRQKYNPAGKEKEQYDVIFRRVLLRICLFPKKHCRAVEPIDPRVAIYSGAATRKLDRRQSIYLGVKYNEYIGKE